MARCMFRGKFNLLLGVIDKKEAKKFCKPYICWLNIKSKVLNKKSVFIEAIQ